MPCVYILHSFKTKKIYIGSSHEDTADTRLRSHNSGKTKSTKFGRPWVIIHQEQFLTYTEARKREIFFKSGQGRKLIKEGGQDGNALVLKTSGSNP